MAKVELYVNGMTYGGWKRARVQRGIEQIAGQFELAVSERWPGQPRRWKVHVGDPCEVRVDGETVITGFVDDVGMNYDASAHEVSFRGRDATGLLVDCSAPTKQWLVGLTLEQIAKEVCKPYGVGVVVNTDIRGAFEPRTGNHEGESVFELLTGYAKRKGVLLVSDGKGNLVITRAGAERVPTELVSGRNILRAELQASILEWYRTYKVKAPDGDGSEYGSPMATATDSNNPRPERNLTVVTSEFGDLASLKKRADWEAHARAAQAFRMTVTVQGWKHAGGVWTPNTRVTVRDEVLGVGTGGEDAVAGDLLIAGVTLMLDEQGTRTELVLAIPQAFDLLPIPKDGLWWTA